MSDAGGAQEQYSEEELRAALGEMRQAPVGEIVAQVVSLLANGAQVKLGRRDGRLLIDLTDTVMKQTGAHLDARFTDEVGQVLSQLRMAQVEAEKQVAASSEEEHNDLDSPAGDTSAAASDQTQAGDAQAAEQAPPSQPQAPPQRRSSKLWTPGS